MAQNGFEASKTSSSGRPRHQITRSISEFASPIRLHRQHSNRAIRDNRDTLSPLVQSPLQSLRNRPSFEGGSKSEGVSPNISPNASRRTSVLYTSPDDLMPGITTTVSHTSASAPILTTTPPKKSSIAVDPDEEKQKAAARKSGLQRSLVELETLAGTTTRRLDDTYYSVLEKLGALQNTIAGLKELAGLHRELPSSFNKDADEIVEDVGTQLDAFGQFEDQQQLIESLQGRIYTGREAIKSLSERVDVVRARIENWERADREWQERTRKRLKAVWVISSIGFLCLLLIFASAQYGTGSLDNTLKDGAAAVSKPSADGSKQQQWPTGRTTGDPNENKVLNLTEPSATLSLTNDILRTFDEL
ncbi:hypothetical protein QBC35DRAFT_105572 [Podospora australis]|uniref:Uncharacterized protein n=1 Tax=Podospora australis TaxID=1536484 RepID=A0AAN7AQ02_9PEZI|nr:hypothetical protein QBC35DRAFT_105572 [Podospora australis]